jgi:hypothetical protein
MTPFTEDAMTRPLFEEPGPHIERVDAWSGPQGFLFGGMAGSGSKLDIAQDFMEAAYVLTEAIKKGDWEDYRLASPVLFLYRHSIELLLKGVMGDSSKTHRLADLADRFATFIRKRHDRDVPAWITKRLKEIAAIDPNSTAFRYGTNHDPKTEKDVAIVGADELYVSLPHLQNAMVALNWALASVVGGVPTERMEALARQHAASRDFD